MLYTFKRESIAELFRSIIRIFALQVISLELDSHLIAHYIRFLSANGNDMKIVISKIHAFQLLEK
jgi:hypothetical protein